MDTDIAANPVRVGLIGVGYWGARVAEAARIAPEIRITHCYARTEADRNAFAARYGYQAASSYQEILENPEIEGVLLITPNRSHRQQILAAVEHGKHIFVDKPITATLEEGVEVVRAVERSGLVLATDHEARCEKPVRRLKEMLDAGALGRLLMADANISTSTGLRTQIHEWRADRSEVPGGALIQIGIHLVDSMQYLLGPIVRVQGWQRHRYIPAAIDDMTVTLLEFANGMYGYLGSGYASAPSIWMRVYGDAAVAVYDRFAGLSATGLPVGSPAASWTTPPTTYVDPILPIAELLTDFAAAVRTGKTPEVGGRPALRALAVVLAAVQSNQTGRAVNVDELLRTAGA
jgi:predicted dehydrogenase